MLSKISKKCIFIHFKTFGMSSSIHKHKHKQKLDSFTLVIYISFKSLSVKQLRIDTCDRNKLEWVRLGNLVSTQGFQSHSVIPYIQFKTHKIYNFTIYINNSYPTPSILTTRLSILSDLRLAVLPNPYSRIRNERIYLIHTLRLGTND